LLGRVSAEIKVDDKYRITIPSKMRQALGSPVIISRGVGNCLYLMSEAAWVENFEDEFETAEMNDKAMTSLARYFKSGLTEAVPDAQGRIIVNQTLRDHAKIGRESELILTPMSNHIEIWAKTVSDDEITSIDADMLADIMAAKGVGGKKKSAAE
jgi:MraZ protein